MGALVSCDTCGVSRTQGAQSPVAPVQAPAATKSSVVVVVSLAGASLFGPIELPEPATVKELRASLTGKGGAKFRLLLGTEELADEKELKGGNQENPLAITLISSQESFERLSENCKRSLQDAGFLVKPLPCFKQFLECIYFATSESHITDEGPGTQPITTNISADLLLLPHGRFLAANSRCQVSSAGWTSTADGETRFQVAEGTFEVQPDGHSIRLQTLRAAHYEPTGGGKWSEIKPLFGASSMLPWAVFRQPLQVGTADLLKLPHFKHERAGPILPPLTTADLETLKLDPENRLYWQREMGPSESQSDPKLAALLGNVAGPT